MYESAGAATWGDFDSIQGDILSKLIERLGVRTIFDLWYALQPDEIKSQILESREFKSWFDRTRRTSPVLVKYRSHQASDLIVGGELEAREVGSPVASWTMLYHDASDQNLPSPHVNALPVDHVEDESASLRPPSTPSIPSAVFAFGTGVDGARPSIETFLAAANIAMAVTRMVESPDVDFDDSDGSLSFDFRLPSGYLTLADFEVDGSLDASIYDDQNQRVRRLPEISPGEFVSILREYDVDS